MRPYSAESGILWMFAAFRNCPGTQSTQRRRREPQRENRESFACVLRGACIVTGFLCVNSLFVFRTRYSKPITQYVLMNKPLSVAAVDLDDTIVRSDWTVSERTLRALRTWQERRGPVVIATGRPPRSTRKIPDVLHAHPWICYNGAVAHIDGEEIYRNLVPIEVVHQILEQFRQHDPTLWLGLEINDRLYINQPTNRADAIHVENLLEVADQPVAKVLVRVDDAAQIDAYLAVLPEGVRALVSTKVPLVQVMAHTASKGAALAALVARWDLALENVVAFGDDVNDVEMVQESGLGVAMNNAVPEVKAVADCITASNDDDGVALVLEKLLAQQQPG